VHDTPSQTSQAGVSLDPVAVGLDLGTSSLKGVAIRPDGTIAARAGAPYPTARPLPGRAEQDPAHWLAALRSVTASLATAVDPARWAGIGLSAMLPTLVVTDDAGEPVGPAITWEDNRAEAQGTRLRVAVGADDLYARTGQWVDGRYLLPVAMWLREAGDPRSAGTTLVGAKDWLFGWLTGTAATDPSTATGFGCYDLRARAWDDGIVAAAFGRSGGRGAVPPPRLPAVLPSSHAAPLSATAAAKLGLSAGIPVALGAADSVLAARGLGVTEPGRVACVAGTSTVVMGVAAELVTDPAHRYLVTPLDREGAYGLEMDLVATGSAVRWLAELLGLPPGDEREVWRLAEGVAVGADGMLFLPYVGPGEQGALWDPGLRGTLTGATLAHGGPQVARALLDGITLESRRCVAVLEALGGGRGDIVMSGPSVRTPLVTRALADATGRRVRWATDPDHPASAWGAAALAFEATGAGSPPLPSVAEGVSPDPDAAPAWDALWDRFERTRIAVAALPPATMAVAAPLEDPA
jgi:xylulokinase